MLSLKSFHIVLIWLAVMLGGGLGAWAAIHHSPWMSLISFTLGALLVVYGAYFAVKTRQTPLE